MVPHRPMPAVAFEVPLQLSEIDDIVAWRPAGPGTWVDPVAGLVVSAVIAWSAFGLLKSALHLSLDGVPEKIDKREVEDWLAKQPGVANVHDLDIWPLSTTTTALTVHLVMPAGSPGDIFLDTVADELEHRFSIEHATLQVQPS